MIAGRLIRLALLVTVAYAALTYDQADGHYQPGTHNTIHAITWGFCGHRYRDCAAGNEAKQVASCETGRTFDVHARSSNGLWWGLWQQSAYSRRFGDWRWNPWAQADSAYRAWRANGSCWTCNQQWPNCGRGLDG